MHSRLRRHAYGWITLVLFLSALAAHFSLAMLNGDSVAKWAESFFENIQSEAAQLLWQVCGLAWFLQVGSPSSKEAGERVEAKIDLLVRQHVRDGDDALAQLDKLYMRER